MVLTVIVSSLFAQIATTVPVKLQKTVLINRMPTELRIPENVRAKIVARRIDLSAAAINFSVVSCTDKYHAVVKIEGVVKNVGTINYTSGAGQQAALLYENRGGRPVLVATKVFQNLTPGQEVRVEFTRNWYKGSPAEGEFPPTYVLIISYDPDIYIDANDNNDDSNTGNNRMEKFGQGINAMTFPCN
jgi:hypothetical protein